MARRSRVARIMYGVAAGSGRKDDASKPLAIMSAPVLPGTVGADQLVPPSACRLAQNSACGLLIAASWHPFIIAPCLSFAIASQAASNSAFGVIVFMLASVKKELHVGRLVERAGERNAAQNGKGKSAAADRFDIHGMILLSGSTIVLDDCRDGLGCSRPPTCQCHLRMEFMPVLHFVDVWLAQRLVGATDRQHVCAERSMSLAHAGSLHAFFIAGRSQFGMAHQAFLNSAIGFIGFIPAPV